MTGWIRWTAPAAAVISLSTPAYAVQYLSVSEAQRAAFPSATFTEVQPGRVWKTSNGGIFVVDHVIGKRLYIDYAVSIDTASTSCNTGSPMAARSEARAGSGKTSGSPLKVGADIRNISGATLSSMHVTEGVKRILDAYGHLR